MTNSTITTTLGRLVQSPLNPRTDRTEDQIKRLAESIKARGVLIPLIVHDMDDGTYGVIDGESRRLAMIEAGYADDAEVSVIVRDADIGDAITANGQRTGMSTRDMIVAIKAMSVAGDNIAHISQTLGIPKIDARRWNAYGNVHPSVFSLYEKGKLPIETLRKFAEAGPRGHEVADELGEQGLEDISPWELHGRLRNPDVIYTNHQYVRILGREAIEQKYGGFEANLFGEGEHVADPDAVRLAISTMLSLAAKAAAKEGWHEVMVIDAGEDRNPDRLPLLYGDPDPKAQETFDKFCEKNEAAIEEGDDDEIEEEYWRLHEAAHDLHFTDKHRAMGRAEIYVGYDEISTNYYVAASKLEEATAEGVTKADIPKAQKSEKPDQPEGWNGAGLDRLAEIERSAAAAEIAASPEKALTLLATALAHLYNTGLGIRADDNTPMDTASGLSAVPRTRPKRAYDSDIEPDTLTKKQRNEIISHAVAAALPKHSPFLEWIKPNVRKHWTPDEDWLSTLTKGLLIDIACDLGMGQDFITWDKAKKGEIVEILVQAFAGELPEVYGNKRAKVYAAAKTWLPGPLRAEDNEDENKEAA